MQQPETHALRGPTEIAALPMRPVPNPKPTATMKTADITPNRPCHTNPSGRFELLLLTQSRHTYNAHRPKYDQ